MPTDTTTHAVKCSEPKWAALVDDTLVHAPQQIVTVDVLKSQASIGDDFFLVRDHNSQHDSILQDNDEIDLAIGNVFYRIRHCDAQARPQCESPAKLAYFVDDRAEITTNRRQTGKTLRALFNVEPGRRLIRDFESPNDDPIAENDSALFDDGPVFVTRHGSYTVIINGRRRELFKTQLTFDEIVDLAFDDPPQGEFICFTITYRGGDCSKPEGTLIEGESVTITKGMIFNVTATDKS